MAPSQPLPPQSPLPPPARGHHLLLRQPTAPADGPAAAAAALPTPPPAARAVTAGPLLTAGLALAVPECVVEMQSATVSAR